MFINSGLQNVNMLRYTWNCVTRHMNTTGSNKSLEIIETPAFYDILDGIEKYRDVLDVSYRWIIT